MSVHEDRGAFVVRWREGTRQRSRRFSTRHEAEAFERAIAPPPQTPERSSTPGVYPYPTNAGTRWCYVFRDAAGRQSRRRGFRTERAAAKARAKLTAEAEEGRVIVGHLTFGEYFPDWLRRRRPYLTPGTWDDYEVHGRKRLVPAFGPRRLTAITTFEIQDWLVELFEAGEYAPKTLNNALGVLVSALNSAASERLIPVNPAGAVERLPLDHIEPEWLRLEEIDAYLDACSPVYRPLAETLVGSGMRISEALALAWDDVDFERSVIRVYRSAKRAGAGATKGKRFRAVQIGPGLVEVLRDLRARRAEIVAGDLGREFVFAMPVRERKRDRGRWASEPTGMAMDRNTVSQSWHKEALEDAGLRDMPLHALRHTAAAAWLLTPHPLIFVQRQLGHASITTTERYYGHLEQSFMRDASAQTELRIRQAGRLVAK